MTYSNVVLDASVVIKWFRSKDESGLIKARAYRRDHLTGKIRISVPELLYYEVLNALATKPGIFSEQLNKAAVLLEEMGLDRYPLRSRLASETVKFKMEYNLSFYDASYIALASILETEFVTADEKLVQKLHLLWVRLLM